MILAHKICLAPTQKQQAYFLQAAGVARFSYNWALTEWRRQYQSGENPNEGKIRKQLNAIKREEFPWMLDVSKTVPQQAIKNLGRAYRNFFDDLSKHRRGQIKWEQVRVPDFKRKGGQDSFCPENGPDSFVVEGKRIKFPVIGWICMREKLRFRGNIRSAVISRTADRWFVSIQVEVERPPPIRENQAVIGVDLGITTLATLSDGRKIAGPKALRANLQRLRRLSKALSRKKKGSANRKKSQMRLARLHARIANIRKDALHKLTSHLTTSYAFVGIEDLNVRGMLANRCLARAIGDIGMGEFGRQSRYKAVMNESCIVVANRFEPSSKRCSCCSAISGSLPLSVREWTCAGCGLTHDRDENAAKNLENLAAGYAVTACGVGGSGLRHRPEVKLPMTKQELNLGVLAQV